MSLQPYIRSETPADYDAVRRLNESAFNQPDEAQLVDALRNCADSYISLVADLDGRLVGHIMFTPVTVQSDDSDWPAIALAPMAVDPTCQRQGIGSALVRAGVDECRNRGEKVVFVLGHVEYYPRFGFEPAPQKGLRCEYPVPDDVFMVLELEQNAIAGRTGLVKYADAFKNV